MSDAEPDKSGFTAPRRNSRKRQTLSLPHFFPDVVLKMAVLPLWIADGREWHPPPISALSQACPGCGSPRIEQGARRGDVGFHG